MNRGYYRAASFQPDADDQRRDTRKPTALRLPELSSEKYTLPLGGGDSGDTEDYLSRLHANGSNLVSAIYTGNDVFDDNTEFTNRPLLKRILFGCTVLGIACVIVITLCVSWLLWNTKGTSLRNQSLLVISLDGFKPSYLAHAPYLSKLADEGLVADHLEPSFPTLTFPNHHSIATGLLPADHGVVSNIFKDTLVSDTMKFNYTSDDATADPRWWGGDPVWLRVERMINKSKKSSGRFVAVHSWPGVHARPPSTWKRFSSTQTAIALAKDLVEWVSSPRFAFGMAYFSEPDHTAHRHGPNTEDTNSAVALVDDTIKSIHSSSKNPNLNIVVVSDHGGMRVAKGFPNITLARLLGDRWSLMLDLISNVGTLVLIEPKLPYTDTELAAVLDTACLSRRVPDNPQKPLCRFYTKANLPPILNYSNSKRVSPVVGLAAPGYYFVEDEKEEIGSPNKAKDLCEIKGVHGYPVYESNEMYGVFIGHGPFFKKTNAGKVPGFKNTHVSGILTKIVEAIIPGLTPDPEHLDYEFPWARATRK